MPAGSIDWPRNCSLLRAYQSYVSPCEKVRAMVTATGDKLRELLADFDSAMLVTRTAAGELRSRPMAVADVEPGGCLWFVTERHSGKLEEIAQDDHVNIAMQSKWKFVSISGRAVAFDDARKVAEIW